MATDVYGAAHYDEASPAVHASNHGFDRGLFDGAASLSGTDGSTIADSISNIVAFYRHFTDGIVLSDTTSTAVAWYRNFTDGMKIGDSFSRISTWYRHFTDGLKISDWGPGKIIFTIPDHICGWDKPRVYDLYKWFSKVAKPLTNWTQTIGASATWTQIEKNTATYLAKAKGAVSWTKKSKPDLPC